MPKPTISIIAKNYWSADFLKSQMNDTFGDLFQFTTHSPDTNPIMPIYNSDMVLLHEPSVLEDMYRYIKCDCPTLLLRRTITASALEELRKIPARSKALVVNLNDYMARETLINIYQLGIKNIRLSTWTPDNGELPDTDYIITPRIYDFLPSSNTPKILLGSRILEIDIIMDILSYFNMDMLTTEEIVKLHMDKVPNFFHGVNHILENNRYLSVQLDLLFNNISKSIAVVDKKNIVTYVNSSFASYLGTEVNDILNNSLEDLVDLYSSLKLILSDEEISDELIDIDGQKIILNTTNLFNKSKYMGKLIKLELYDHIQLVQQKSHDKIVGRKNTAKYSFDNLIGKNSSFQKSIQLGKKVANSNSPILIYGESGTGKELMASAIHNYSNRRDKPYIAVNCGSIPNELLESEFFGYEEGAFTGSKKGGSMGLFEKANGGTIFLDEISEIPYNLQSRLLRVLQEKEIRKVGSNYNISIDVRVIAASNKDLYELAEKNGFRKDLYFRLNVFQITIPPLRKRKSDIEVLCSYFLENDFHVEASPEFFSFINNYSWPGNIRELKNLIEFAYTTGGSKICISSLPNYLKNSKNFKDIMMDPKVSLIESLVIKLIFNGVNEGTSTSRTAICDEFSDLYYDISEVEIRKILSSLEKKDFIHIPRGRSGCGLTSKGLKYMESNNFKVKNMATDL